VIYVRHGARVADVGEGSSSGCGIGSCVVVLQPRPVLGHEHELEH
jgi:hypothetical protein